MFTFVCKFLLSMLHGTTNLLFLVSITSFFSRFSFLCSTFGKEHLDTSVFVVEALDFLVLILI